ncbi:hypothetical protein C8F04DRAFT_1257595 [Mycena alexandri]|uniref:Uncharacterized protein n=1 Tax=Mycena alexandri TaxID=1745969 RepID=A0AAD6X4V3_9AGAR|nr:hypothetical protein C8F04DRAFT_1257595 [Mycena alexandri]
MNVASVDKGVLNDVALLAAPANDFIRAADEFIWTRKEFAQKLEASDVLLPPYRCDFSALKARVVSDQLIFPSWFDSQPDAQLMPNATSLLSLSAVIDQFTRCHSPSGVNMRVPIELVENIIDASCSNSPTLAACSLVCKQWLPRSRHHLFSSLDLSADWTPEPNSVTEFFKVIDTPHSTLIPYVTGVVLSKRSWGMTSVHKILTTLARSGIHPASLHINCPTYEPVLFPVFSASLVHLALHLHIDMPMAILVDHVCAFPLLETLYIGGSARYSIISRPRSCTLPSKLHTLIISNPIFAEWVISPDPVPSQISTIVLRDIRQPYQWSAINRYLASAAAPAIRSLTFHGYPQQPFSPLDFENLEELQELIVEHRSPAVALFDILHGLRGSPTCNTLETIGLYVCTCDSLRQSLHAYWRELDAILADRVVFPQLRRIVRVTQDMFGGVATRLAAVDYLDFLPGLPILMASFDHLVGQHKIAVVIDETLGIGATITPQLDFGEGQYLNNPPLRSEEFESRNIEYVKPRLWWNAMDFVDPDEEFPPSGNDFLHESSNAEDFPTTATAIEVDEFLSSVELPKPTKHAFDHRPSRLASNFFRPVSSNKWAWNGGLRISVSGELQTVCSKVTLTDATEAAAPRLASFILSTMQNLELTHLYDIADLHTVLLGFKSAHQFARLIASGPDEASLNVLSKYLSKKKQAFLIPAHWDGERIGVIVFTPPTARYLLRVPPDMCRKTCLIAALLFNQDPSPNKAEHKHFLPLLKRRVEPAVLSPDAWRRSIREEYAYHLALCVLQLPKEVREFIFDHASTVWFNSGNGDFREDQDTQHLHRVLRKSKLGVVPPESLSANIVFVHVGALKNIHNLPHLTQRRLRSDIRFCLYGTHETVPSRALGTPRHLFIGLEIDEKCSLGGVVTFTPEALAGDAFGVLRTIYDIHAHPLWTCYLLPAVLGMAVKLAEVREDETPHYTGSIPYNLNKIIESIIRGDISIMHAPPVDDPFNQSTETQQWVVDFGLLRPQTSEAVLHYCAKAFTKDIHALVPPSNWTTRAAHIIAADMRRMQIQPALMGEYRRFVVLDWESSLDVSRATVLRAGIEWGGLRTFSFNDNFKRDLEFS